MRTTLNAMAIGALALIAGCAASDARRTITAHVEGGAGKVLYFNKFFGNKPQHVDSVTLDGEGQRRSAHRADATGLLCPRHGRKDMLVLVLDSAESVTVEAAAGNRNHQGGRLRTQRPPLWVLRRREEVRRGEEQLVDRINTDRADTTAIGRINAVNRRLLRLLQAASPRSTRARRRRSPPAEPFGHPEGMPLFIEVREALAQHRALLEYYAGFRDQVDRMEQQTAAMKAQQEQMASWTT